MKPVLHPNIHITVLCFNKCSVDIKMASPIIIPKGTNKYIQKSHTIEVNRITRKSGQNQLKLEINERVNEQVRKENGRACDNGNTVQVK